MSKSNLKLRQSLLATCMTTFVCMQASLSADVSSATKSDAAKSDAANSAAVKSVAVKSAASKPNSTAAAASPPPFKVAGTVSRTLQTVTGINFLASFVAGQAAKTVLKKKLGGDVKVKVKLYSFTDLLSGKVKAVDCSLAGSNIKGVNVGHVNASTSQPIWLDLHDKRHIQLKTPVLVSVKASLTPEEISAALKSEKVGNSLRGLNLDLPGLGAQQLQVVNPKVEFIEDNVCIQALLKAEGADDSTGVPLKITGKLKLKGDDRVEIADLKVEGSDIIEPEKFANFAEELLNPLIDLKRMDRKDHAFRLSSLNVGQGGLTSEGRLIIAPKNPPVAAGAGVSPINGSPGIAGVSQKTE
ncbi:MAG: hypothetical protein C0469_12850 [Cyanobacteria bacterium DS2.3.42]|nr:hypothetical protein [Cyanobacteria bacterium DS2.3.42]